MAERDSSGPPGWWAVAALLPVAAGLTWLSATAPVGRMAVVGWTGAGLAWAVALASGGPAVAQRRALAVAVALSALLLVSAPPRFSDDLWRYLFDGRVSAMGLNPFSYAPANPKIAWVAPELVAKMNFPTMRTIYPPIAQALFALVGLVEGGDQLWRGLLVALSWLAAWLFGRGGSDAESRAQRQWGIASSPLVVVSAGSLGALDVVGLLVAVALLSSRVGRSAAWQGFWVGVGAGVKLFPAVLFWTTDASRRLRTGVVAGLAAASVVAAAYLPIASIGSKALGSLSTYSTAWSFNGGPARWTAAAIDSGLVLAGTGASVELPTPAFLHDPARRVVDGEPSSRWFVGRNEVARAVTTLIGLMALLTALVMGRRRGLEAAPMTALCLLSFFAVQFTVYPWYGLWLVPASVTLRGRGWLGGAALAWTACLPLALWTPAMVIDGAPWQEPLWVAPLLWTAVVASATVRRDRV